MDSATLAAIRRRDERAGGVVEGRRHSAAKDRRLLLAFLDELDQLAQDLQIEVAVLRTAVRGVLARVALPHGYIEKEERTDNPCSASPNGEGEGGGYSAKAQDSCGGSSLAECGRATAGAPGAQATDAELG
jgi:hypothetical protein